MAGVLYISEFEQLGRDDQGNFVPVGMQPELIATQAVSYGALTQSTAFNSRTRFVRLQSTTACNILFGTGTQTAVLNVSPRLAADAAEYFGVTPGHQIGVIDT